MFSSPDSVPDSVPSDRLLQRFFRLSSYNILSNLMTPLASSIDLAFLGHLEDIRFLAGVALATVIFNYIYWGFGFLRMGTTGMTAQAVGKQDHDGMILIILRNGAIAIGLGAALLVLHPFLREIGFALLQGEESIKLAGREYFNARIWGAPAYLLNLVCLGSLLGREQGRAVLLLSMIGNGTNVILNYIWIVRLGWGSAGAGWATAGSEWIMVITAVSLIYPVFSRGPIRALIRKIPELTAVRAIFSLNRDILIRTFALVTAFSIFTNLGAGMGTTILAANAVLLQILSLAAFLIDGFAFATESLAGIAVGAKSSGQLKALLWVSGGSSLCTGLVFAIGFVVWPDSLFGLLTDQQEVLDQIGQLVGWLIPVLGCGSIAFALDGYFFGLTYGRILRQASLWSALLGFAPIALLASLRQDPQLLWLAMTTFMLARGISLSLHVPETLKLNRD